jgi:hypothetical protein
MRSFVWSRSLLFGCNVSISLSARGYASARGISRQHSRSVSVGARLPVGATPRDLCWPVQPDVKGANAERDQCRFFHSISRCDAVMRTRRCSSAGARRDCYHNSRARSHARKPEPSCQLRAWLPPLRDPAVERLALGRGCLRSRRGIGSMMQQACRCLSIASVPVSL